MYRIDFEEGSLTFVDESPLPKFALLYRLPLGDKALIGLGGFCSLFPNQLSIYDENYLKTTSLRHDNAEHVY